MNCIFCKIANKEIPSQIVFEDDNVIAFKDLNPQAPVHILVIPKNHISSINEINSENSYVVSKIFEAINKIVVQENISESGYRVISNCGENGCQTVMHLHFHILGGKKLSETF
ncbi:MAG: histidine triad nucleotide-binding protein [Tissierellia bacterium]|nr:histidine triad nucleotide-binding protein [Tissierellia bacterium]MDD4781380.1 histidine triad nucleotide-binding protein [Tissierellia bacterium]